MAYRIITGIGIVQYLESSQILTEKIYHESSILFFYSTETRKMTGVSDSAVTIGLFPEDCIFLAERTLN